MNRNHEPEIEWSGPDQRPSPAPDNPPQCPLCTTILHNLSRRRALAERIVPLVQTEQERNHLMTILYAILREHGGEIVVRRTPTNEEIAAAKIEFSHDADGALRISLPNSVIVEAGTLIRTGA